jgi:hypothetical protein
MVPTSDGCRQCRSAAQTQFQQSVIHKTGFLQFEEASKTNRNNADFSINQPSLGREYFVVVPSLRICYTDDQAEQPRLATSLNFYGDSFPRNRRVDFFLEPIKAVDRIAIETDNSITRLDTCLSCRAVGCHTSYDAFDSGIRISRCSDPDHRLETWKGTPRLVVR